MGSEMEPAALALFTLHPNSSVHELNKSGRNGETQAGAAVSATHGSVSLRKGLKDRGLFFYRNSDARI